ncbi:phytanoyl-CoA dioxygenase family protein [Methylibium sp.]|uniref:phytanoyl-CoA dioxygenase family protein n=1 Tax=Methylibium sp. TaxID=2067992 RepID=UPI0017AC3FB7|nr:phytanoyl-CoA dioxygenase family protein [Methylibium sp.]MBA3590304.1 phytanoyl-CoA dioxygenase family protein [Methylibium sp.]
MNSKPLRSITEKEVCTFEDDGVVVLREMFDPEWIEQLRLWADEDMAAPGQLHQNLTHEGKPGRFFFDTFMWTYHEGFKRFVHESPAAEIAGSILRAKKINIFFDQLLIKEPGTAERTPWHHDMPYWPVRGNDICTLWLALDQVTNDNGAVEYIKGSHKWGVAYKPPAFAGDDRYKIDLPEVPDIESERDKHEFLQFELNPGDCTVHHGLLVHGAPGNSQADRRRRAVVSRWAGDDAVYHPQPNIQKMMWDPDITPGGPLDSDLWPVIWRRS